MVPIIGRSRGNNGAKEEEIKVKGEINTLCTLENSTAAANDSGAVGAVKGAPPTESNVLKRELLGVLWCITSASGITSAAQNQVLKREVFEVKPSSGTL